MKSIKRYALNFVLFESGAGLLFRGDVGGDDDMNALKVAVVPKAHPSCCERSRPCLVQYRKKSSNFFLSVGR